MNDTYDRIPEHLRRFVVDQDYAAYDELDQAVWRFILLQTYARLTETAHPAYAQGLRQTGISVERIPSIARPLSLSGTPAALDIGTKSFDARSLTWRI